MVQSDFSVTNLWYRRTYTVR